MRDMNPSFIPEYFSAGAARLEQTVRDASTDTNYETQDDGFVLQNGVLTFHYQGLNREKLNLKTDPSERQYDIRNVNLTIRNAPRVVITGHYDGRFLLPRTFFPFSLTVDFIGMQYVRGDDEGHLTYIQRYGPEQLSDRSLWKKADKLLRKAAIKYHLGTRIREFRGRNPLAGSLEFLTDIFSNITNRDWNADC